MNGGFDNEIFYTGEFEHSLDSQRRVAIPKPWRGKGACDRFFLVPGRSRILQLIPFAAFRDFLAKARKIPFANAETAMALARFGSRAQECICDKQGRLAIPRRLLDYAELAEQVVLVGAISTIQVWRPERWIEVQGSDEDYLDEVERIGAAPDDFMSALKGGLGL